MTQKDHHVSPLTGWVISALPPLFWAGNIVVGRAASHDIPPVMLAFARNLVGLLVLLPFGWGTMRRDLRRYWMFRWLLLKVALAVCRT